MTDITEEMVEEAAAAILSAEEHSDAFDLPWGRRLIALGKTGVHMGDCTKQCFTCDRCLYEDYTRIARAALTAGLSKGQSLVENALRAQEGAITELIANHKAELAQVTEDLETCEFFCEGYKILVESLQKELNPQFSHRADCKGPHMDVTCFGCIEASLVVRDTVHEAEIEKLKATYEQICLGYRDLIEESRRENQRLKGDTE